MKKDKKKMVKVPNLRFPEFEVEWEKRILAELCEKIGDGIHSTPAYDDFGNYYFINGNNLENGQIIISESTKRVSKKEAEKYNANDLLENTILISINGTIGNLALYNKEPVMLGKSVCYINLKITETRLFIFNQLNSKRTYSYFLSELTGTTIKNLSLSSIRNTEIYLPSLKEQKKIAELLSLINQRIQAQSKIIENLESLMQGLREKIFSQNLRFKDDDGNNYPDWQLKKLGDVCIITMGQSPSSTSYNTDEIGIPLIQGNADIRNRITSPRNWTTEMTKECKIGDLILTVRAPVGAVAKSLHNACIGRGVCTISVNSKYPIEFIYQFLIYFEAKWTKLEQGSTFTAISGNEIKKIELNIPCIEEQTQIADFLSKIDKKIEIERKLLQQFENQKTNLLSNLFL